MVPEAAVQWNPVAEGYPDNPWPQYAELVEDGFGRHELGPVTAWRHADVSAVLRGSVSVQGPEGGTSMLDLDPPDHTRLRALVSKAFTPRSINELEPLIKRITDQALDELAHNGGGNLVDLIAFPIPFRVINEMLGMPAFNVAEIRDLSGQIVKGLEPVFDPELAAAIEVAGVKFDEIIAEAIEWKRSHRSSDMLTALIDAEAQGERLTQDELVQQVGLLFIAGHETTVNLISGGIVSLFDHPAELRRLRDNPNLDGGAIDELLRYDSPVHLTGRVVLKPLEINGFSIDPGQSLILGLAAANRDPRMFGDDANELRIDRPNAGQHLSFSAGPHHCLGSALARLEGRVVIPTLLRRFPELQLNGPVGYNGRINLRGPASVPVTV